MGVTEPPVHLLLVEGQGWRSGGQQDHHQLLTIPPGCFVHVDNYK